MPRLYEYDIRSGLKSLRGLKEFGIYLKADPAMRQPPPLADESILVTDLMADAKLLAHPVPPGSAADLSDRMILAPIALNRNVDDEACQASFQRPINHHGPPNQASAPDTSISGRAAAELQSPRLAQIIYSVPRQCSSAAVEGDT